MKEKDEDWTDQEVNIMRFKRLRYLGFTSMAILEIKSGKEADRIIETGKRMIEEAEREELQEEVDKLIKQAR